MRCDPKRVHTLQDTLESVYWSLLYIAARDELKQTNTRTFCSIKNALMDKFVCGGETCCWACRPCIAREDRFRILRDEATSAIQDSSKIMISALLKELGMVFLQYNQELREVSSRKHDRLKAAPDFECVMDIFHAALENDGVDLVWYWIGESVEMRTSW